MTSAEGPPQELLRRIAEDPIDVRVIAQRLDALDEDARVAAIRALGRSEQRRLYAAAENFRPLRLADLVPAQTDALVTVRHFGRNTLPAFTHFEKRFCRPAEQDPEKPEALYGFNFQALGWLTGPGYFVAREGPDRPEIWIDYHRLPPVRPPDWPEIRSNERGAARFVYGFMVDTLRRVSEHVTIGSAARRGKDLGSWFVLCRQA